eukprot:TRINITY_DN1958_c0_g1_i1.p1 TRINITY_DN1958_c0_g1~~TRINITY_DN1958_c0_g1_i1.p1  ORF type:complete len:505 (+),score=229.52 TRINITY_DN1958_c0_g1_i1:39-1553(+)
MSRKRGGGDPKDQFWASVESQKQDTLRWCLHNCNGLEASTQNEDGLTSFMLSAKHDKWKSMQQLIDFYARAPALREHGWVECQDEDGKSALMYACESGSLKSVDFLLDAQPQGRGERRGVNAPTMADQLLKQKDKKGKTAYDHAKLRKRDKIIEYIDDYLAPPEEVEEVEKNADGISSTQKSKQKKRAMLAQSGGDALEKHLEEEKAHNIRLEAEKAADNAVENIKNRKPVWVEIEKVDKQADNSSKICELNIVREKAGGDCPAHGDEKNPVDPALWDLAMLNRLSLKLPKGMLTSLPSDLQRLTVLQILIVSKNSLSMLPEEIGLLSNLKVLEAEDNDLTVLPKGLGECKKLEVLKLGRNKVSDLDVLRKHTNLTMIHCNNNQLTSLEAIPFENLARLSELCMQGNAITELPDEVGSCPVLSKISLQNNQIKELPAALTALKKVKEVNMDENPLKDNKVKKYLDQGGKGLKDLWKYLEKNAKKGGGGKKKKKKTVVESDEEED